MLQLVKINDDFRKSFPSPIPFPSGPIHKFKLSPLTQNLSSVTKPEGTNKNKEPPFSQTFCSAIPFLINSKNLNYLEL